MTTAVTGPRDVGIQSLRGVAVVLMVAGHVIGSSAARGLQVADDSAWRFAYLALDDVRMPLFTVMSGYVYAYRPVVGTAGLPRLVVGKVRRLLVPMTVVGTVFFFVQQVVPGTNARADPSSLWRIYVFGYEHFWFLQAIFLIFLGVGVLDALGLLATPRRLAGALSASCLLFLLVHVPAAANVLSVDGFLRLLPFFLLGCGVNRFTQVFARRGLCVGAAVALVPVFALRLLLLGLGVHLPGAPARVLALAVGLLAVLTLLAVRDHLRAGFLVRLGGFSFGIYLLHVFGSSSARLLLRGLGVDSTAALFAASLAVGIALPVVFELLLGRWALVSWGVLGQRPVRRRAALAPAERRGPVGDAVS